MAIPRIKKFSLLRQSFLATTGFAAGLATVAAAALSGGEAKAIECDFSGGGFTATTSCANGIPYTLGDKDLTFIGAPPTTGAGTIEWFKPTSEVWQLDTDYVADLAGPANNIISYRIDITDPGAWFSSIVVDSGVTQSVINPTTLFVEIFSDAAFNNRVASASSFNGSNSGFVTVPGQLSTIFVRETLNVGVGAVYDFGEVNFRQEVPGPLPLLGAGAAFGFSRKLRRRVNGARKLSLG